MSFSWQAKKICAAVSSRPIIVCPVQKDIGQLLEKCETLWREIKCSCRRGKTAINCFPLQHWPTRFNRTVYAEFQVSERSSFEFVSAFDRFFVEIFAEACARNFDKDFIERIIAHVRLERTWLSSRLERKRRRRGRSLRMSSSVHIRTPVDFFITGSRFSTG